MLSGNPNILHLPVTHHPQKNITHLLGMILLFGTNAEKGLLIYV